MKVDLLFSELKCRQHAEPAWLALPEQLRGDVIDLSRGGFHIWRNDQRAVLVASGKDLRVAKRRSYARIALIEHGIGQSYSDTSSSAYPGGDGRDAVSLFLSPNRHAAARDQAAYPGATVATVGCPKLATLPTREGVPGRVVALSFHWDYKRVPEMRSAWQHFKPGLAALRDRFEVIGHAHPYARGMVLPTYRELGIEYVDTFDEVCRRADVYVADNTSTLFEFAATGRPVVVLNAPWYRVEVEHGLRFWAASGVGVHCNDPQLLPPAIEEALRDHPEQQEAREAALRMVYASRKGSARKAARAIAEWAA